MPRQVILFWFALALMTVGAAAQTNTFPASGNVGVGTTSPTSALEVVGTSLIVGHANIGEFTNGTAVIDAYNGDAFYGNNSATNGISINASGYVGIGTASPAGQLNVVPTLTLDPNTASKIILGGNTGVLQNSNFDGGANQIIIQASSYTNAFNGHAANSVLVSGGNITGAPGIGAADIYGGSVSITGGTATGVSGATALGGAVNIQGGLASAGGYNYIGSVYLQASGGNVGIGTTSPGYTLDVSGKVHTASGVVYPDGTTQTTAWTGALCGGDYAESVDVTGAHERYEPGDVMVVDPDSPGNFLKSSEPYSTLVAGIYSTKPGVVGRRFTSPTRLKKEIPMAMIGIVPTKVSAENGAIMPGDLLVTSSTVGYAMKGTDRARMTGAIVGKALGSVPSGTGVIEVLVTLQ